MSLRARLLLFTFVCVPLAAGLSCSANSTTDPGLTGGSDGTGTPSGGSHSGGAGGTSASGGTGGPTHLDPTPTPQTPDCGDGAHNEGEECDDTNTMGGDGWSPACRV